VDNLRERALGLLEMAESQGDVKAANGSIREARGCIETLFKVAAVIQEQRFRQADVEWWARQLLQAFETQLEDVAAGHLTPDQARDRILNEVERLSAAGATIDVGG
jgi:hypothetical protein